MPGTYLGQGNVARIAAAEPSFDVSTFASDSARELRLGAIDANSSDYLSVQLGTGSHYTMPTIDDAGVLRYAEPSVDPETGRTCLVRKDRWHGVILLIEARNLDFVLPSLLPDVNLTRENNLYIGGEGPKVLAQFGKMKDYQVKAQLFALVPGMKLLVVDRNGCVLIYWYEKGRLRWKQATPREVADYVEDYARKKLTNIEETIRWAIRLCTKIEMFDHVRRLQGDSSSTRVGGRTRTMLMGSGGSRHTP